MTAAPEQKIGRFPILKVLGRGAQGAVYLAKDPDLDRLVAVKLVAEVLYGNDEGAGPSSQARNLAQLRHPNIVALHEAGRIHGFTYLVFEYLEGTVLREELAQSGPMGLPQAYSTMIQIVDAMAYAHAKGILHLDLNPNNIMRDEAGRPRIVDFDLSRAVTGAAERPEVIAGTASYMAPEYRSGDCVDARADVYALGRIFHDLLTGRRADPSRAAELPIGEIDPAPLRAIAGVELFLDLLRRATAADPERRYRDARHLHEAMVAAWRKTEASVTSAGDALHGTVAYVMRRIERKGDFPAVSRTLAEVNQLTSGDQPSSIARLTDVVLRDYALTSRLLKLANSAGFAPASGSIKTVSDAIRVLGTEQVRLTCNGLTCFGHFAARRQDQRLREESVSAFVTGLIARYLAQQVKSREVEQAFLAGMLYTLGRMLALYYFTEDFQAIEELVARGASEEEAAHSVLGLTLSELGVAVGRVWGLPEATLACMGTADAPRAQPTESSLSSMVRLAHCLVEVDADSDPESARLLAATARLRPAVDLDLPTLHALLGAAVEKFRVFAQVLEVDVARSTSVARIARWLDRTRERIGKDEARTAAA
ncbi:MAG: HDOD domain-containing protein [Burkholderiales bacterium]|nr:HDOD domain-containing protein [Burkholderiales bacterium]